MSLAFKLNQSIARRAASAARAPVIARRPAVLSRTPSIQLKGKEKSPCACGGGCPACKAEAGIQTKFAISERGDAFEQEADRVADQVMRMPTPGIQNQTRAETEGATKVPISKGSAKRRNPCTRNILAEGSCADLVKGSKWICCDPDNGTKRPGRTTDVEGTDCPSQKFTPIFTCDSTCDKALAKGCSDSDNWMAIPPSKFTRTRCNKEYTICANGEKTTGYVRDKSETSKSYEVSPGIQTALGVTVGDSFLGAIYEPGAKQAAIDNDACCNAP